MSADTLTSNSRDFFEQSKLKKTLSLTFAGIGLLLLGFSCAHGGESRASQLASEMSGTKNWEETALENLAGSFGFGMFLELMGAILAFAVSLYFSPLFCGSLNEKKTLRTPLEIEQASADYGNSTAQAATETQDKTA